MGKKLFDYVIGNPPYQEEVENNGRSNPVYHLLMDASYEVADVAELITPARFLFNAGQTPKAWNRKMLDDEHFKVLQYESDGTKIFPNTDIKGGVCISYHDNQRKFEPIELFCAFPELNSISIKVWSMSNNYLDTVICTETCMTVSNLNGNSPCLKSEIIVAIAVINSSLFIARIPS